MFAIIADETLYLKADDTNRAAFEAEGMGPFTYQAKDRVNTMSYWEVPERLLRRSGRIHRLGAQRLRHFIQEQEEQAVTEEAQRYPQTGRSSRSGTTYFGIAGSVWS